MGLHEAAKPEQKAAVSSEHIATEDQNNLPLNDLGLGRLTPNLINTLQRMVGNAATRRIIANTSMVGSIIQREEVSISANGNDFTLRDSKDQKTILDLLDQINALGVRVNNRVGSEKWKTAPTAWTLEDLKAAFSSLMQYASFVDLGKLTLSKLSKHPDDPHAFAQYDQGTDNISIFEMAVGKIGITLDHSLIASKSHEERLGQAIRVGDPAKTAEAKEKFPKHVIGEGTTLSSESVRATLLHELAHARAEKELKTDFEKYWEDEETLEEGAEKPPTRYGEKSLDEDIAETVAIYLLNREPGRTWLETQRPDRYQRVAEWVDSKRRLRSYLNLMASQPQAGGSPAPAAADSPSPQVLKD